MSELVRPHRRQSTRLRHPWDSPGKNTGMGCHFLLQCMKVKSESEVVQCVWLLVTPWTLAYQAPPPMGFSRQEYWSGFPLPSPKYIVSHTKIYSYVWGWVASACSLWGNIITGYWKAQGHLEKSLLKVALVKTFRLTSLSHLSGP